ncbi:MAG TPA: NADH-quinone oxidoreductase subunit K, partial [Cyclobacteriaceae bacterium]|nr:NADH-quinone oxidoreductase subunit K [Cyclobacteriaceae bacterium]
FDNYLFPGKLEGHFFSLFIIAIAAAEAAVAIAIFINLYRNIRSIDVEQVDKMKY